jgi:hypothetical protein
MNTVIILGIIIVLGITLLAVLINYGNKYMASNDVINGVYPGDDLIAKKDQVLFFAKEIDIDAPAAIVWKHVAQQGQKKAGFYSFELLERLLTFKIRNTYNIVPEWSELKTGEWIYYHQMGIGSGIMEVEEGKYFTMLSDTRKPPINNGKAFALRAIPGGDFAWTWNFHVTSIEENRSKLVQRCHCYFSPNNLFTRGYIKFFLGIPSIVMTTRQMFVLKACAEGRFPKQQVN